MRLLPHTKCFATKPSLALPRTLSTCSVSVLNKGLAQLTVAHHRDAQPRSFGFALGKADSPFFDLSRRKYS